MQRDLIPGVWGRCGRAIADPQACEMDNVVPLRPLDAELGQGRHATNPVPRVSMFCGKPAFDYEADLSHEDWLWRRRQLLYVLAANFIALGSMGLLLYWAAQ